MNPFDEPLPQLSRHSVQPEKETEDPEIWFPDWKCFCCHDSGVVVPILVRRVIPGYNDLFDRPPACQRCSAGESCTNPDIHDLRFNRKICNQLDKIERDGWIQTAKANQQRIIDMKALADSMAMPGIRDRTANDEREIQQRKQEVEAINQ